MCASQGPKYHVRLSTANRTPVNTCLSSYNSSTYTTELFIRISSYNKRVVYTKSLYILFSKNFYCNFSSSAVVRSAINKRSLFLEQISLESEQMRNYMIKQVSINHRYYNKYCVGLPLRERYIVDKSRIITISTKTKHWQKCTNVGKQHHKQTQLTLSWPLLEQGMRLPLNQN